ncbi:ATP-binding protein [Pseudorhizobium flavum]|uniref:ATP-binding protein n=1 Tax=Pseudorhizobium flavum TaxID=1335061 RepID=UPI003770138D
MIEAAGMTICSGTTSRNTKRWRFGIGTRLGAAFVAIVGLAVGASLVGWFSYRELSGELSRIVEVQMPQLAFATRLSKAGADIGSVTAALTGAETRAEYDETRQVYAERLSALQALLEDSEQMESVQALLPLASAINENLALIDIAAGKRFTLAEAMRADLDELRWVQADLIEEADPLVDDIRFNVEAEIRNGRSTGALGEQQRSEALLTLVSQANLATGLLARLASSSTAEEVQEANAFLGDSADELAARLTMLEGWPDSLTVRQLARRILQQSDAATGTPNRKRFEMREAARLGHLAKENGKLVAELGQRIEAEVVAIEASAEEAARRAAAAIDLGRKLLAGIAVLAVVLALVIGIFYVHRSLLSRINQLAHAATAISEGNAAAAIPAGGDDELADLARALVLFRQTRDELVQSAKLAALGQMAAGIGHELNQPLAAIRAHIHSGSTHIARGKSEQALHNFEKIRALTARMASQISHIRRFARRPDSKLHPVDLAIVVREALSLLEHRFEDEGVTLQLDIPREAPAVMAEPVRLEQVVVNLVANALDAVAERREKVVTIAAARGKDGVTVHITDSGPGIDAAPPEAVFDPFFTTKPAGAGLGLGLSISYNIIKDFGGSIAVLKTGPAGTTFVISLKGAE